MYRIAIVDDEQIVKLAVKSMIDWTSGEFELAGTAGDGLAALQVLDRTAADIVITDLKMPRMDGLEFLTALKSRTVFPAVLVLSNHGDFEFVREAMRRGARDYLMKTDISPEILMQSLRALADSLETTPVPKGHASGPGFLIRATDAGEGLDRAIVEAGYNTSDGSFAVMQAQSSDGPTDLDQVLGSLAEQGLKACHHCICAPVDPSSVVLIAELPKGVDVEPDGMATWLVDQARMYYGCELGIVHSAVESDWSRLKAVLAEASRVSEQFYYGGPTGRVLAMRDYRSTVDRDLIGRSAPRIGDDSADGVKNLIEWCRDHRASPRFLKREVSAAFPDKADQVQATTSDRELLDLFLPKGGARQYRSEVQKVMDYVTRHLNEKISVARLAELVRMSETYLCTIFKAQTGKSIISYINDAKLDRAKELLATGKYLVKEAATEVGIEDPFYFNRLFKRRFGKTPSEILP